MIGWSHKIFRLTHRGLPRPDPVLNLLFNGGRTMKVKEVCRTDVRACVPQNNLATAAGVLWEGDCGILPVTDGTGKVVGVVTDRDICMATATKHRRAEEIAVSELIGGRVRTCGPEDSVLEALRIMREGRVRRLPVVDAEGKLKGILSINDLVRRAKPGADTDLSYEAVILTLQAVGMPWKETAAESKKPAGPRRAAVTAAS